MPTEIKTWRLAEGRRSFVYPMQSSCVICYEVTAQDLPIYLLLMSLQHKSHSEAPLYWAGWTARCDQCCQVPVPPYSRYRKHRESLGWPVFQSCAEASISVLHAAVLYRLAHRVDDVRPRQVCLLVPVPSSFKFRKYLLIFFLGMSAACVIASIPNHFCEPLHMVHRIITKLSCSKRLCSTWNWNIALYRVMPVVSCTSKPFVWVRLVEI